MRRSRLEPSDGPRARDGDVARLRREPGRAELREDHETAGGVRPGRATSEPGDGRPVRARLHLQARHRCGGAGLGRGHAGTTFTDPGYCIEYGKPVYNYDTDSPFGRVSFFQALQYSINSVFCEVGKRLGAIAILDYGRRFGMYANPGLELPARSSGRAASTSAASCSSRSRTSRPTRADSPSGRSGSESRPYRWRWSRRHRERRRAHAAIPRPAHPRARREGSRTPRAERGRTRHEAVHRPKRSPT